MVHFMFFLLCIPLSYSLTLPETAKNPFQYFEENNYPYENHTVVTEDGYKLLLVRVFPNGNISSNINSTGPPILFVHGTLCQFWDFFVAGPQAAFGFKALEQGYDVFFLNCRGNRWSRSHTSLDPDADANVFWNFSWHEIGVYDLSAAIDYITNLTGYSNVSYVGHSQGSTAFLVLTSIRPEYNSQITLAVLLCPVAYMEHATSPGVLLLKDEIDLLQQIIETLQINEFIPYNAVVSQLGALICASESLLCEILSNGIVAGPSTETNQTLISAYLYNTPAGCSIKQPIHYLQNANSGGFRQYNYGEEINLNKYGQSIPPDYNLTAVTTPVAMYYTATDYFVAISDELRLAENLPNVIANVLMPQLSGNHLDPFMGKNTAKYFVDPSLELLNEYNNL